MDGHEREDVVDYWNKVFLPVPKEFEKHVPKYEIWIWRERSQKFKRLCQSWKKVSKESSFNITTSAASMPIMMLKTYGESFH